jgi:hypothetical protein
MKAYRKKLDRRLIDYLNNLYEEKGSWWQNIVDDDEVFILVRDNHLRVQVHGGLLLMIGTDNNGKILCKTHEEYLNLRSEGDPYVTISETRTDPPKRVEGLGEFVQHYGKIKRRIKFFVDSERQYCHSMSIRIREIVEREVGLVQEEVHETIQRKAQFVDLQAVSDDGKMVFVEVKLFNNPEIRSWETPSVVTQLKKYQDIIKLHKQNIINSYVELYETYSQLKGNFFSKVLPHPSKIQIYPTVRLIVSDFDGGQLKHLIPTIRGGIEKGMGWARGTKDLITVGKSSSINSGHIFKGI